MRIAIVGAGPAGLRAAQLLERQGAFVQVFEGRERVGGRLHTVATDDGGFYEGGGEWIDKDHTRVLEVMKEHGLEPELSTAWPGAVIWQGDEKPEDNLWEAAEKDAEHVHHEAALICKEMTDPIWENQELAVLDTQTLAEFLDDCCTSPEGRWWAEAMQRSDEGEDTSEIGLLGWLVGYRHYLSRAEGDMSLYRVPGGAGRLCEKMAESLKSPIHLNRVLRSVSAKEEIVELWFDNEMVFCDKVIFTLPPKALLDVDFEDAIPGEKLAAWENMGSSRAIKVALEFSEVWWTKDGKSGRIMTDLPCQQVWESGRDGAKVLCAYICGQAGEDLVASSDPVGRVLRALAEIDLDAQKTFVRGTVHDWINDPLSQGAFSHLSLGSVTGALPYLSDPVGRLHFAGEHTAQWLGFIEGAFESAERVAAEVLAS